MTEKAVTLNQKMIDAAVKMLHQDGVICYPTEGVWGLGCNPQSELAVNRLLEIKGREASKGLILVAGAYNQLQPYAEIPPEIQQQLENIWPGFVTCLLPKSADCPSWISGAHDKIAIRLSQHPLIIALCEAFNGAIISTSANRSGEPPVSNIEAAKSEFREEIDYYVDAPLGNASKPSRIIDLTQFPPVVIRP